MEANSEPKSVQAEVLPPGNSLPVMEINIPHLEKRPDEKELVSDEQLVGLYTEILGIMRAEREEVAEYVSNFANMVFNDGDASSASKEALVSLFKTKTDVTNNMTKVMDLLLRAKLKERDTFRPQLNATQHNEIKITGVAKKRQLLDALKNKAKKEEE
jgi:hypothetical protein